KIAGLAGQLPRLCGVPNLKKKRKCQLVIDYINLFVPPERVWIICFSIGVLDQRIERINLRRELYKRRRFIDDAPQDRARHVRSRRDSETAAWPERQPLRRRGGGRPIGTRTEHERA